MSVTGGEGGGVEGANHLWWQIDQLAGLYGTKVEGGKEGENEGRKF